MQLDPFDLQRSPSLNGIETALLDFLWVCLPFGPPPELVSAVPSVGGFSRRVQNKTQSSEANSDPVASLDTKRPLWTLNGDIRHLSQIMGKNESFWLVVYEFGLLRLTGG